MRTFCAALALVAAFSHRIAIAQDQIATRETELRQPRDIRSLWPMLPGRVLAQATAVPVHLRYQEMSATQKESVRSQYENLGPDDEPPFPEAGLAPLLKALHEAQSKLLVQGDLFLVADIDPTGQASKVTAYSSPSPQMARIAAQMLMLTRFKAAKCAGEPCTQQFPLRLKFKVEQ